MILTGSGERDGDELRSFGRRRGRKLSERQDRLLETVLGRVAIDLEAPAPRDAAALFGERVEAVWLEVGFGGGEHLVAQACANPAIGLIGAEPFIDGVVKVLDAIETEGLSNVRVHADDVRPLLRWLPEASISRAFVLFPDPWPKSRHVKRRLVNTGFFSMLARVMVPGGELRIGSDIPDYIRTILIAAGKCPEFVWTAQRPGDWQVRPDDWPMTRYEAKAEREGRRSTYLSFTRS